MATRRRFTAARGRTMAARPRRKRVWARTTFSADWTAAVAVVDLLAGFRAKMGISSGPPGATIGGIKLTLFNDFDAAHTAVTNQANIYTGILVGPDTLDNVDLSPSSNLELDWMFWHGHNIHVGSTADTRESRDYEVRAMRKLDELGDTLWLAVDGVIGAGPTSVNLTGSASVLIILP